LGVGASGPVRASDIAKITAFYESRGATPTVFVTRAADPSLHRELAAAGYVAGEREQSLLASEDLVSHAQCDARIGVAQDIAAWAKASAAAFLEREQLEPGEDVIALILATAEGTVALEARDGDRIIATGAISVSGEHATLFAGSTDPKFRRQGWHTALIRDRVARAREAGAKLVRATARPGSISEQNFVRCGFIRLSARILWERRAGQASSAKRADS
jgi:GNAT superfamily N-acetyltransferase